MVHRCHCLPATFRLANIEKSVRTRPTSKKNDPKNGFYNYNAQSDPSLTCYNVVDAPNDTTSSTNRCFPGSSFTSGLESKAGGGITLLKYSSFTYLAIVGTAVVGLNIHDHDIFLGTVTAEYFMQVGQIDIPNGHVVAATLVNQRHLCTSGTKMKKKKGKEGVRTKIVRRNMSGNSGRRNKSSRGSTSSRPCIGGIGSTVVVVVVVVFVVFVPVVPVPLVCMEVGAL